ncbi:MAG: hypothetical protein JSW28_04930 [Thermoplasmata archaeon]|nr:MAG: hypothetical protein JSW28_04930 [Thermoplasmata archaeon]
MPDFIHMYQTGGNVGWPSLKDYIQININCTYKTDIRDPYIPYHLKKEDEITSIAEKMVRTKVFDISDPSKAYDPFPIEIEHEKKAILDPTKRPLGVLYDGYRLMNLFRELLPESELSFKHLHIIFTNRLIGTWEKGSGSYHARVCVLGFPCIISTTGVVEAPAKPREFYIARRALVASGMAGDIVEAELKKKFAGRFIDYGDKRLIDILKGYIIQALFYHATFDPFCHDKHCRLFNAHWQEDMIQAQLGGKEFCERHEGILGRIIKGNMC